MLNVLRGQLYAELQRIVVEVGTPTVREIFEGRLGLSSK